MLNIGKQELTQLNIGDKGTIGNLCIFPPGFESEASGE